MQEAAGLGRKVAVCDFVKPSPAGTTWGKQVFGYVTGVGEDESLLCHIVNYMFLWGGDDSTDGFHDCYTDNVI